MWRELNSRRPVESADVQSPQDSSAWLTVRGLVIPLAINEPFK